MTAESAQEQVVYLVRAQDERDDDDGAPLWWSNEAGWSTLDYAIVYTETEQQSLDLPLGGEWVRFVEAPDGT